MKITLIFLGLFCLIANAADGYYYYPNNYTYTYPQGTRYVQQARNQQYRYQNVRVTQPTRYQTVQQPTQYVYQTAAQQPAQYQTAGYSLQSIAQARANAMASYQFMTHAIESYGTAPGIPAGVSEGIGYGVGTPATCVLPGGVVADAMAVAANGLTYRVRFFQ